MSHYKTRKRFRPETTVFYHSSKILPELLEDVIACYLNGKRVCRFCYYRRKSSRLVSSSSDRPYCAKCQQQCDTVWLMPASRLCENFGNLREVPIPPAPRWFFKNANKPFGFCERNDHYSCFEMSATSEIWFAHTIEELVIWTIEREHNCSFSKYIKNHRESSRKRHPSYPQSRSNDGYYKQASSPRGGRHHRPKTPPPPPINLDLDEFEDSNHDDTEDDDCSIYDPEEVEFQFYRTRDIPVELLEEVITCYRNREEVCKWCFFLEHLQQESGEKEKDPSGVEICAKCNKDWEPVTIIPASRICRNFANLEWVPVSDPVPQTYPKHPHEYCAKDNHMRCFEVYVYSGFWYAHSLEELVVWTVEKEFQMDFADFEISQATQEPRKPLAKAGTDSTSETVDKYHPREMSFHFVSDIPTDVLISVAKSFKEHKIICRMCFFDSLNSPAYNRNPTVTKKSEGGKTCEKGHRWMPIRVLPASPLCITYASFVAVPPIPNHMQNVKSAFVTCNNKKHDFCFKKSRDTNPWFPHTIEEMVMWTVERETGQNFAEVYQKYLPKEKSHSTGNRISAVNSSSASATNAAMANDREAGTGLSTDRSPSNSFATTQTVPKATASVSKPSTTSGDSAAVQTMSQVSSTALAAPVMAAGVGSASPVPAANKISTGTTSQKPSSNQTPPRKSTPRYSTQSTVTGFGLKKADSHDGIRMPAVVSAASVNGTTAQKSPPHEAAVVVQSEPVLVSTKKRATNYATVPITQSQGGANSTSPAPENVAHGAKDVQSKARSSSTATSTASDNSSPASNESSLTSPSPPVPPSIPSICAPTSEVVVASTVQSSPPVLSPAKAASASVAATSSVSAAPSSSPLRPMSPTTSAAPAVSLTQPMLPQANFLESAQPSKPGDFQVPFMAGGAMYRHPVGDMSLPTGGLTLNEATMLFPALLDNRGPSIQPFLSQAVPSNMYGPRQAATALQNHATLNSNALQAPSAMATGAGLPVAMDMTASGLHSSSLSSFSQNEDEEEEVFCCYLCYREFDSAQEIAKHCQGVQHLEVVKRDSGGEKVWHWYPPPPDKSPDDFRMCSRLERCSGRLRCCKAHSAEELREWSARHTHREKMEEEPLLDQVLISSSSLPQSLLLLSPNKAESQCSHISIAVNPITAGDGGKTTSWMVTLIGQGWQTLFAVDCFLASSSLPGAENVFKIVSIKGDTFFTIKPKSSNWVAQAVKEGILLGRVTLRIRALPSAAAGSYVCQLRFNIGFRELLYTKLEFGSQ